MAEKNMKARIVHKHDVEVNWNKATSFIPKQGEVIVYDIDANYDYERIKVGDGVRTIIQLPFVNDEVRAELSKLTSGEVKVSKAESADKATTATTADSATRAQSAVTAQSAQTAQSATIADTALVANSATQDGSGRIIADTYETKADAQNKYEELSEAINNIDFPEQIQVDWNQNDSAALDYVKNRTHWVDTEQAYVTIVDNQPSDINFGVGYSVVTSGVSSPIVEGSNYLVTFDGTDYSCMAYFADGYPSLGDSRLLNWDTDVNPMEAPFCLQYGEGWTEVIGNAMLAEDFLKVWDSSEGTTLHRITIKEVTETLIYHKLDPKFLPKGVQSDWDQTDETAEDFIKNKPDEDDAFAFLEEMGLIRPALAADGSAYVDENGAFYSII